MPLPDELKQLAKRVSNWGRWGEDDQRGTLNHIDSEARRRAAAAVRHGVGVSCAWELDTSPGGIERSTMAFRTAGDAPAGMGVPGQAIARWQFSMALSSMFCAS